MVRAAWHRRRQKNDAIEILNAAKSTTLSQSPPRHLTSTTCFLRELILFTNTNPFSHNAEWLPAIEKHLYLLHQNSPVSYMLLAEVVSFTQKLATFISPKQDNIDNEKLLKYIHENNLYNLDEDFLHYKNHPTLSSIYSLICQSICFQHLDEEQLNKNMSVLAHYYALSSNRCRRQPA